MVEKIKQALEQAYLERQEVPSKYISGQVMPAGNRNIRDSTSTALTGILNSARNQKLDIDRLAENRIVTFDKEGNHLEAYRLLRTKVSGLIEEHGLTTIGITSPGTGEGKSLTSVNLAISLSKNPNLRVILIDGDISNPSIHRLLTLRSKYGFIDVLKGKAAIEEVIVKLSLPNLWLIPGREGSIEFHDQISSIEMSAFISQLPVKNNHVVIVDLPPVLGNDDTLALAAHMDGILLVVEEGATVAKNIKSTVDLLEQSSIIGTVLNKSAGFW